MDDFKMNNKYELPKKYECALCHKKYATPFERMQCESACIKKQNLYEQKQKEEQQRIAAKIDSLRLQNEYNELIKGIKRHVDIYKERVKINDHYYGMEDNEKEFINNVASLLADLCWF
jgi:hypothetical protein